MPGNVFVDPCAPDEPTALLLRNVYARSQLQLANPYRVQGNLERDFMEQTRWLCFTIPNPRFAGNVPTVNLPSSTEQACPQIIMVGQPKNHISDLQFEKFPTTATFQCCMTSFKTAVCSRSSNPSEPMLWIEEGEVASCVDDLRTSRSMFVNPFQNFETLHAKIASSLKKILQNSHFRKSVKTDFSVEDRLWKNDLRILSGDWSTGGCSWFTDLFSITLHGLRYPRFWYQMGPGSAVNKWSSQWQDYGKLV